MRLAVEVAAEAAARGAAGAAREGEAPPTGDEGVEGEAAAAREAGTERRGNTRGKRFDSGTYGECGSRSRRAKIHALK